MYALSLSPTLWRGRGTRRGGSSRRELRSPIQTTRSWSSSEHGGATAAENSPNVDTAGAATSSQDASDATNLSQDRTKSLSLSLSRISIVIGAALCLSCSGVSTRLRMLRTVLLAPEASTRSARTRRREPRAARDPSLRPRGCLYRAHALAPRKSASVSAGSGARTEHALSRSPTPARAPSFSPKKNARVSPVEKSFFWRRVSRGRSLGRPVGSPQKSNNSGGPC